MIPPMKMHWVGIMSTGVFDACRRTELVARDGRIEQCIVCFQASGAIEATVY